MKKIFLILLLIPVFSFSLAQDIIVLKKYEHEMKCQIIHVDDSLITYRLWKSHDESVHTIKRSEVLSYLYKKKKQSTNYVNHVVIGGGIGNGQQVGVAIPVKREKNQRDAEAEDGFQGFPESANPVLIGVYRLKETVKGYVVNTQGDSLEGWITVNSVAHNQVEVNFTGDDGVMKKYDISGLKAYGYDKVRYEKVKTGFGKEVTNGLKSGEGFHFLHLEVDGPAKLYRFYTLKFRKTTLHNFPDPPLYFGKLKSHFVIVNPQGEKLLTKGRTIKGCVNKLFNDNTRLMMRVRAGGVNAKKLPAVVMSYNEWYMNKDK